MQEEENKQAKRETTLDIRGNRWSLVIDYDFNRGENLPPLTIDYIYNQLISDVYFIAIIEHDRDYLDNGTMKVKHFHVVIETIRTRKGTLLDKFSKLLELPKNVISIEKAISFRGAIRYLLHIDNDNKAPYFPFEIRTNNDKLVNDCFIDREESITSEGLIEVCRQSDTLADVLVKIGLDNFQRYSQTIKIIFSEVKGYSR